MSAIATAAPFFAYSSAIALPRPLAAPVMSATLPSRLAITTPVDGERGNQKRNQVVCRTACPWGRTGWHSLYARIHATNGELEKPFLRRHSGAGRNPLSRAAGFFDVDDWLGRK